MVLVATSRVGSPGFAGLAIGLALAVVHLIGIPLTGTSVNPARSLGPAIIVGHVALSQVWLFIVAPLIGGAVAALLYRYLRVFCCFRGWSELGWDRPGGFWARLERWKPRCEQAKRRPAR